MKVWQCGIFVKLDMKLTEKKEVIEYANDTSYGLAAAVFTSNITRALKISNSVQAGSVFVRMHCSHLFCLTCLSGELLQLA